MSLDKIALAETKQDYGTVEQPTDEGRLFTANHITLLTMWSTFLSCLDASLLDVSVVSIADDLGVSLSLAQWVLLIYLLVEASLFLVMGRIGDMKSKKTVYQAGMVIFLAASVLCALAPSFPILLLGRALQGVGSATMCPLGLAIISHFTDDTQRGQAIGYNMLIVGIGLSTGPPLGGFLTETFGWRSVFYVNLPIGFIALLVVQCWMPHTPTQKGARLDVVGAFLLLCMVATLLLSASLFDVDDWILSVCLLAAFVVLVGLLGLWLRCVPNPLVPLRLLADPVVLICLACGFLLFLAVPLIRFLMPVYLQEGLGWSPFYTGIFQLSQPISFIVAGPISGRLTQCLSTRAQTTVGLSLWFCGALLLAFNLRHTPAMVGGVSLMAFGIQIFFVPNAKYLLANAERRDLGITSALNYLARSTSFPLGISLVTLLYALLLPDIDETAPPLPPYDESHMAEHAQSARTIILIFLGPIVLAFAITACLRPEQPATSPETHKILTEEEEGVEEGEAGEGEGEDVQDLAFSGGMSIDYAGSLDAAMIAKLRKHLG